MKKPIPLKEETPKFPARPPEGRRVWEVLVDGESLKPEEEYTVAANALLAQGGHEYDDFEDASTRTETDQELTELIIEHLQDNGPVSTPSPGRIEQASKP